MRSVHGRVPTDKIIKIALNCANYKSDESVIFCFNTIKQTDNGNSHHRITAHVRHFILIVYLIFTCMLSLLKRQA